MSSRHTTADDDAREDIEAALETLEQEYPDSDLNVFDNERDAEMFHIKTSLRTYRDAL